MTYAVLRLHGVVRHKVGYAIVRKDCIAVCRCRRGSVMEGVG